ncbi:uncharacterized protein V1518DRAFT_412468 [Limtongia smithiae]|uniref:uncharacterized protein n=1 Tax=Limtongia smithiae TaxID=1125753 RepID=UPI0034CF4F79
MNTSRIMDNANIRNIKDAVQNMSLYDVKAYVRKAQNVMMNATVIETKVREATNNEPWGASSTLMQEIADGTFSYSSFNEIMPMIYKRFTEKTAAEWRQIYKALQLLEFLIKHGSERVIDDARAHMATITMLRSFHYIDPNGKDQGINVRTRSKELVALLGDDDRIRAERKKARAAKDKFIGSGAGGGSDAGGFGGSGKKYGGFGSDQLEFGGGYSGRVFGDGGGFGGEAYSGAPGASSSRYSRDDDDSPRHRSSQFEEYDAGLEDDNTTSAYASIGDTPSSPAAPAPVKKPVAASVPSVDLFSFDDDSAIAAPTASSSAAFGNFMAVPATTAAAPAPAAADDDDFADFQSAVPAASAQTSVTASITALFSAPATAPAQPMYNQSFAQSTYAQPQQPAFFSVQPMTTTPVAATTPTTYQQTSYPAPNYNSATFRTNSANTMPMLSSTSSASSVSTLGSQSTAGKKKDDVFGSLWTAASTGVSKKATGPTGANGQQQSMAQLAQQSATAGIWSQARGNSNTATAPAPSAQQGSTSSNMDDLLSL